MRQYMAFTLTFTLVTVVVVLLNSESAHSGPCDPRLAAPYRWTPPRYPGAQVTFDRPGDLTTGYLTAATPAQVFAFYATELGKVEWQPDSRPAPESHTRYFRLQNCCNRGWLEVAATADATGVTSVLVKHGWVGDCG